jgi:hypothetical protein
MYYWKTELSGPHAGPDWEDRCERSETGYRIMLVEFQQALADLVAPPDFCREILAEPHRLKERYDLSEREYDRLVKIVNHKAMP